MTDRYKDADREWWKVSIKKGRSQPNPVDPDEVDQWWDYTIYKEEAGRYRAAWKGSVFRLAGATPTVETVMRDFAASAARLAVGFAASASRQEATS